jgi:hypothetical protein
LLEVWCRIDMINDAKTEALKKKSDDDADDITIYSAMEIEKEVSTDEGDNDEGDDGEGDDDEGDDDGDEDDKGDDDDDNDDDKYDFFYYNDYHDSNSEVHDDMYYVDGHDGDTEDAEKKKEEVEAKETKEARDLATFIEEQHEKMINDVCPPILIHREAVMRFDLEREKDDAIEEEEREVKTRGNKIKNPAFINTLYYVKYHKDNNVQLLSVDRLRI